MSKAPPWLGSEDARTFTTTNHQISGRLPTRGFRVSSQNHQRPTGLASPDSNTKFLRTGQAYGVGPIYLSEQSISIPLLLRERGAARGNPEEVEAVPAGWKRRRLKTRQSCPPVLRESSQKPLIRSRFKLHSFLVIS